MFVELSFYCYLVHLTNVFSHPSLDFETVNQRTCPYANDMDQRMANIAEYIYKVSNNIPYGIDKETFDDRLQKYIFSDETQVIVFPHSVSDSQPYFTIGAFNAALTDLSKHSSWLTMEAIRNGIQSDSEKRNAEEHGGFGLTSAVSFYDS